MVLYKQIMISNFQRFFVGVGTGLGKEIHSPLTFVRVFFKGAFPWSLLFLLGLWNFFRIDSLRDKKAYPLVWWGTIFLFFSLFVFCFYCSWSIEILLRYEEMGTEMGQ